MGIQLTYALVETLAVKPILYNVGVAVVQPDSCPRSDPEPTRLTYFWPSGHTQIDALKLIINSPTRGLLHPSRNMQSDGPSRGSMTYPPENSLSSGSNPARGRADQIAASAPTHTITGQSGSAPHRLPPPLDLRQTSMNPSSASQPLQPPPVGRPHTNGSPSVARGYPESSQRTPLSAMATGRRPAFPTSSTPTDAVSTEYSPVQQQIGAEFPPSLDTSTSPFPVGNYNRPDHTNRVSSSSLYEALNPVARSPHPRSTSLPMTQPIQHLQTEGMGYNGGYSGSQIPPHSVSYSSASATSYVQEGFHDTPSPHTTMEYSSPASAHLHQQQHSENQSTEPCPPYSTPMSFSFNNSASNTLVGAVYEPITGMVDLSIGNRPQASTTITTTLHMNVNVTTDGPMVVDSTRMRPSSIPMSNGNTPPSTIAPSATGPPASWSAYPQQLPAAPSASTSMSISAIGNALELKAQVTYKPQVLFQPHLAPGTTYNYGFQEHPDSQLPRSASARQSPSAESPSGPTFSPAPVDFNTEPTKGIAEIHRSEGVQGSQTLPLKKKKKAKMHECPVCGKEFPRPSGLHTHMNTHNNEKPFPCTYPGCERKFGVRSNAKRHLRTHGISPNSSLSPSSGPSSASTSTSTKSSAAAGAKTSPQPYVVGFSEPVIVGGPEISPKHQGTTRGNRSEPKSGSGDKGSGGGGRWGNSDGGSTSSTYAGPPFFKLRWLPPRLTPRTGATMSKNIEERSVCEESGGEEHQKDAGETNPEGDGGTGDGERSSYPSSGTGASYLESRGKSGGFKKEEPDEKL